MPALTEQELDGAGKLIDVLEGLGVAGGLPSSDDTFGEKVLQGPPEAAFADTAARLVGLIAAADPTVALVPLERTSAALFVDSLLAALWKLEYPAAGRLKPSAAAALGAAPNRLAVLDFLAGEAAAARIIAAESFDPESAAASMQRTIASLGGLTESVAAAPGTPEVLRALEAEVKGIVSGLPAGYLGEVLLEPEALGEDGVALLRQINTHLAADYGTRRALLLQRFEVTLRSFLWSKKVQSEGVRQLSISLAPPAHSHPCTQACKHASTLLLCVHLWFCSVRRVSSLRCCSLTNDVEVALGWPTARGGTAGGITAVQARVHLTCCRDRARAGLGSALGVSACAKDERAARGDPVEPEGRAYWESAGPWRACGCSVRGEQDGIARGKA